MCGISSIYKFSSINSFDKNKLDLMNQEMHYRGPDDEGVWNDEKCGLAQVRLSIIGLEKGKQPLFNEDNSIVLVCNGEIYNYIEIRKELEIKGHVFASESDSETIIHLYEECGEKCIDVLRGMFAFILWDSKKKKLFAARDRIGEKTLYYSQNGESIVISTELKAILKYNIPTPQINFEALAEPIRYTSPLNKKDTYIEQIKRLEAGHYITVDEENGLLKFEYWRRNTMVASFKGSYEEAKALTLSKLRESVDLCLRSDVPVAIMLSGGIDSSAIAALAKDTGREVHTITAGYKGNHDCDERSIAKKFAKERGFIYHEIELDEFDFKNSFDELCEHLDEPITDAAAIAQWALYKKVKSLGFKVLLGGMGGDELFYGYPYWNNLAKSLALHRKHQSLKPFKNNKRRIEFLDFVLKNFKNIMFAGHPLQISDKSICFWHYNEYNKFANEADCVYLKKENCFQNINLNKTFAECELGKEINQVYQFAFENIMSMGYLYLTDRLGMGNSIEIRSPFLDYKFVEFVSSLPNEFKLKNNVPKYFLKEVLKGYIPDYILFAQKRGFTPPNGFIKDVASDYNYQFFNANYKFYNSVLADRVLSLNLNIK